MATLEIQTERLLLRDYVPEDWQAAHRYAHRPENIEFMIWGPNTPDQTREFIQKCMGQQRQDPRRDFELAVVLRETQEVIGGCGMRIHTENPKRGDLGYILHADYWSQGYTTEAALGLIDYFMRAYDLEEVQATCDVRNIASQRVMEKCGLRRVKRIEADKTLSGRVRDTYLYERFLDGV